MLDEVDVLNNTWCFLIGSPDISGGSYVIFQHALYAKKAGYNVTIVTDINVDAKRLSWFPEAKSLQWETYESVSNKKFDVAIATWWKTAFELYRVTADHYVYFVQSIESRFYPEFEKPLRNLVDSTYTFPVHFITEAVWIKDFLKETYNKNAALVRNGILKDVYTSSGESFAQRESSKLRILVEGPVDVLFKNVPKTINLCKEAGADEVWLLTSSPIQSFSGVDRVFSKIPIHETPKVYRSCDVVVKLSYVEGMFGPPLEMFHCGGTSITYDVTGHDEYIIDGYNAVVIPTDQNSKVIDAIRRMKTDKNWLDELKKNAAKTAAEWVDWSHSSSQFKIEIDKICTGSIGSQRNIEILSKFMYNYYLLAENYRLQLGGKDVDNLRSLKERIRNKYPRLFALLKKIRLAVFPPR